MIVIDHVAIPVREVAASASFLAEILGLAPAQPAGPEGEMRLLRVGETSGLLFTPAGTVTGHHLAFRVDEATFAKIVERLRTKAVAFGNDSETPANGQTVDSFGGHGRVYFADPSGHFYEVMA